MRPSSGALLAVLVLACDPAGDEPALGTAATLGASLFINEVLANEPGSDPDGEMVELVNLGEADLDLSGFTLLDAVAVRHEFAPGTVLAAGRALVVFGGARAAPPGGLVASSGALGLSNGGDTVELVGAGGEPADLVSYDGALAASDGVSMNRAPDADPAAAFVLHTDLAAAASSPGTHADGSPFGDEPPPPAAALRIAAANLTSGDDQSYDPGHGVRILQGLRPDITLIQELNVGAGEEADLRAFVDQTFGADFAYARQPGVRIPSGVISRYPILEWGVWDDPTLADRDAVYARIDLPGAIDLWAVSLHLSGASASRRATAAAALVDRIRTTVPAGDYLVVGGDLNTGSRGETCIDLLSEVVHTAGPYPVDQRGDGDTNQPRHSPYDWVLADPDLHARSVPTTIGASAFPAGLVLDTRTYSPLSDLAPAQAGDSAALRMQHMAVVRSFALPAP